MPTYQLGQGDEYELCAADLVHSDPKLLAWREGEFKRMGFSESEAKAMARWRDADLHRVARWLARGCSHTLAMRIVAPMLELPSSQQIEAYGVYSGPSKEADCA